MEHYQRVNKDQCHHGVVVEKCMQCFANEVLYVDEQIQRIRIMIHKLWEQIIDECGNLPKP